MVFVMFPKYSKFERITQNYYETIYGKVEILYLPLMLRKLKSVCQLIKWMQVPKLFVAKKNRVLLLRREDVALWHHHYKTITKVFTSRHYTSLKCVLSTSCIKNTVQYNSNEALAKHVPQVVDETKITEVKVERRMYIAEKACSVPPAEWRVDNYWCSVIEINDKSAVNIANVMISIALEKVLERKNMRKRKQNLLDTYHTQFKCEELGAGQEVDTLYINLSCKFCSQRYVKPWVWGFF